uniref:ABC transporter permease n=1 Tax=Chondria sp. (in: red algae) TaxID=1982705 RepID=A0A1Z1MCQ9_9FLOR|nr:hypothetical protein [Chondria sp. (in: red algae)]
MNSLYHKILLFVKILIFLLYHLSGNTIGCCIMSSIYYIKIFIPNSIFITIITSFFISFVFSLQMVKEFLYLNAVQLIGSILSISFIRELSPVLTSIIVIGRVASLFTSQLASMLVTEQIDALLVLGINPINYLIIPRILSMVIGLPLLNIISIFTSLISGSFVCFILYGIHPNVFLSSVVYNYFFLDLFKSILKTLGFAVFISITSCVWGITSRGGSHGVGLSTTSSVIVCLILVFILNFLLSYLLFNNLISSFEFS